jgi:hypothetical protein
LVPADGTPNTATSRQAMFVGRHLSETAIMLDIKRQIFADYLKLTQAYCDLRLKNDIGDNAKIFRSYNPLYGDKHLFSFVTERFDFEIEPNLKHCTLTKWIVDPTVTESIIDNLFVDQINYKKQFVTLIEPDKTYSGRILVSQIDCTEIDGASEVQSLGLVDLYDIPAIDTWFYMTRTKESRLLFAWIPNELVKYADEAVQVNCVDCINWADIWYPQEFEKHESSSDESLTTRRTPNIGIAYSGADGKSMSIWNSIKQWFGLTNKAKH